MAGCLTRSSLTERTLAPEYPTVFDDNQFNESGPVRSPRGRLAPWVVLECTQRKETTMDSLRDLLIHELKDLHNAESQLTKALPKVIKAVSNKKLREAISAHLEETRSHVERLEQAFEILDERPRGTKCDAMEGLIKEGEKLLQEDAEAEVLDAALIAAAQRIEHYEMAGYDCARAFARQLGETDVARLLKQTLDEESAANKKLTQIAEDHVNVDAMNATRETVS